MKNLLTAIFLILTTASATALADTSPVGTWQTIDDETGEAKSIVELFLDDGELKGRIVELLDPSRKGKVCDQCSGDLKDQPIEGMVFLWGLTREEDEWTGGSILDPANGKEYKAKLQVVNDGENLEVRGFIGFSLLGRTQVWNRI